MGWWGRPRLPFTLSALVALLLARGEAAFAAPPSIRFTDPGSDLGAIVAVAVMGAAGGLLLAIVADRPR